MFYAVIVVLSRDAVNSIFFVTLIIFVEVLQRYFCDLLDFIATGLK